jgi:response regulator RpfG family c-di-GMP phosphodiesterase
MTATEYTYRLLVVDDEPYICNIVAEALASNPEYQTTTFFDPKEAMTFIEENQVDLVLTDLVMGSFSGVTILDHALRYHPDCVVILMTAYPTVNNAISVLKKGAYDYLVKPFKLETLKNAIMRGFERQGLARENLHLKEQLALYRLSEAIGSAADLDSILKLAAEAAQSIVGVAAVSVLIADRVNGVPIPFLSVGKVSNQRAESFLHGDAELCRTVMTQMAAQIESGESGDDKKEIQSLACHPLMIRGEAIGLLNVVQEDQFAPIRPGQMHLLSIISSKVASAIENTRLYDNLQSSYLKTIQALANAVEARDGYTRGHTERVTILADLIASRMNWNETRREKLKMGCTLHDIGKIGVPDAILNKPGRLTDEERRQIEMHTVLGMKILEGIDFLKPALPYVLYHHEKYDGTGYPHGLAGNEIPIEGRLLAVVDTYDAIVTDRPYRPGAPPSAAIAELIKFKGIQFDPEIVDILVAVWNENQFEKLGIYPAQKPALQSTS